MKRFKKALLVVLVFAFASTCFLFGAGQGTFAAKKVTLDWWFQDWSGGNAWMRDYIVKFEKKYPGIHLNYIPIPFEELNVKMIPSIAQGNEPPIMFGYDEWVAARDVSKLFLPQSPDPYTVDEWKKAVYAPTLKNVTGPDGNIYGYPFVTGANAFGFIYHKDLFKEAGVDAEAIKSWDDLKKAAKKLTVYNPDGSIKRSGVLFSYTEAANTFLDMICMQEARDKLLNPGKAEWNFNIPEAKRAMETLKSFVDEKIYDPRSGDSAITFPNKIGAMLLQGPWGVGATMTSFPELDVGFLGMPPYPDKGTKLQLGSVVSYGTFFLSRRLTDSKKDAAMTFIKELVNNPAEFFDIPFYHEPPYWVGVINSKAYIAELKKRPENKMTEYAKTALIATEKGLPAVHPLDTKISEPDLIRNILFPQMQKVFLGKESIDKMLSYLTKYLTSREKELAR